MSRRVPCSLPGCRWVPFVSQIGRLYVRQGWRLQTLDGYTYAEVLKNYATRTFGVPKVRFRKGKIRFQGLYPTWSAYDDELGRHAHYLDAPRTRNGAMRYMEEVCRERAKARVVLLTSAWMAPFFFALGRT